MGFFDRFYYGKAGKADYTPDDMPANRFQLFWEVLRVRIWSVMRLNLIQMLFWLPCILLTILTILAVLTVPEGQEVTEAAQVVLPDIRGLLSTYLLMLVPCLLITGPSTAAASYVARNWARDQHSFIWSDFKDALKDNWKQGLLTSAITGAMPLLVYIGIDFYGQLAQQQPIMVVAQTLLVILAVIWSLALVFIYPLMCGYKLRTRQLLRNALLLAIGRLPFALLFRLITLLPMVIFFILTLFWGGIGILVGVIYYLLIGFGLQRLVYASFCNSVFDKFINPNIEGAPMNLGLRTDDEDDDDEEDDTEA